MLVGDLPKPAGLRDKLSQSPGASACWMRPGLTLLGLIFPPVRMAEQIINVCLDRNGLPHDQVRFEVTESLLARPDSPATRSLRELRNAGIEKSGRSYSWKNQKELDAVVKQLKATPDKPAKAEKAAEPAPTKKAPTKKK